MITRIAVCPEPGVYDTLSAARELGLPTVNLGDLMRDAVRDGTDWGRQAHRHIQAGELVPESLLAEFVDETLSLRPAGWLLFGYPQAIAQARLLATLGHAPDLVVRVTLDENRIAHDWRLAEQAPQIHQMLADARQRWAAVETHYRGLGVLVTTTETADLRAVVTHRIGQAT